MLAIARSDDGLVHLTGLAKGLDLSPSQIQKPLSDLVDVGLLTPMPVEGSRTRFLLRNRSAAWDWAEELAASATALSHVSDPTDAAISQRLAGPRDAGSASMPNA